MEHDEDKRLLKVVLSLLQPYPPDMWVCVFQILAERDLPGVTQGQKDAVVAAIVILSNTLWNDFFAMLCANGLASHWGCLGESCIPWMNQNDANSKSAKQRSKNWWTMCWSWSVRNKGKMHSKLHQWVSRRELVDKVSLCCASLRACTVAPGSGTTTHLLVSRSRWSQKWKLIILWVLNKLNLMWSWSGLKASLEAQILSAFQWISAEIPLETS